MERPNRISYNVNNFAWHCLTEFIREPLLEPGMGTGLTGSPWWKWATRRERARGGAIPGGGKIHATVLVPEHARDGELMRVPLTLSVHTGGEGSGQALGPSAGVRVLSRIC